jgi:hypothetical protein
MERNRDAADGCADRLRDTALSTHPLTPVNDARAAARKLFLLSGRRCVERRFRVCWYPARDFREPHRPMVQRLLDLPTPSSDQDAAAKKHQQPNPIAVLVFLARRRD